MLNQIITLLYQKGYRRSDEVEGGVLLRETEKFVYVVILKRFQSDISIGQYQNLKMRAEFKLTMKYQKPVQILYLFATPNGMFEETVYEALEQLTNVWLLAEDTGKIYIFENQPAEFDDLYGYLGQGVQKYKNSHLDRLSVVITPVNVVLVILSVIYFLAVIIIHRGYYAVYDVNIMLKMGALSYDTVMQGQWYRIITSMFLHFGLAHLFNNMLLLFYVGCELEHRIGSLPYFILYMFAGICGNLTSLWYYNHIGESSISAGASGAIFGVIGALLVVFMMNRTRTANITPKRLLFMVVITIYYGMTTMGVDNAAHIGGLLGGIIGGFLLSKISQYGKLE